MAEFELEAEILTAIDLSLCTHNDGAGSGLHYCKINDFSLRMIVQFVRESEAKTMGAIRKVALQVFLAFHITGKLSHKECGLSTHS